MKQIITKQIGKEYFQIYNHHKYKGVESTSINLAFWNNKENTLKKYNTHKEAVQALRNYEEEERNNRIYSFTHKKSNNKILIKIKEIDSLLYYHPIDELNNKWWIMKDKNTFELVLSNGEVETYERF